MTTTARFIPAPIPWPAPPSTLRGMLLGLGATSAMFGGLTLVGIAFAWTDELSPPVQVTLVILGVLLVAASLVFTTSPPAPRCGVPA